MGDDGQGSNLAAEVVSEVVGAILPGTGALTKRATEAVQREWRRNHSVALRAAERVSGMSREELDDTLLSSRTALPLYTYVLWAAGQNGHDQTLRAMGAVLGTAAQSVRNDNLDSLADAEDTLRAMSSFTTRHFEVLHYLLRAQQEPNGPDNGTRFSLAAVAAGTGIAEDAVLRISLRLESAGVTREIRGVLMGPIWRPTDLGHAVYEAGHMLDPS